MRVAAFLHVTVPGLLCVALANTNLFDRVQVDLDSDHYAEQRVESFPAVLAMPWNSVVNLLYVAVGLYWLSGPRATGETHQSRYLREVFALMTVCYAPVQWARLATLRRAPAVLDQWFTLPIFAWVPVWSGYIDAAARGPAAAAAWRVRSALALELCSVLSYGLALAHALGFDAALGCHVALAVYTGARVQLAHGDGLSRRYLLLAVTSCAGFVVLKLLDHRLAQYWLFRRLTGHFWSKVCDVLQIHFSFRFLTTLTQRVHGKTTTD
ncbi:transmembrane protein 187 [Diretmus argenteus]